MLIPMILGVLIPAASALQMEISCPQTKLIASGITDIKPATKSDLFSHSVRPQTYSTPDSWPLDSVSNHGHRKLYLSCIYENGKVFSKKIPLKTQVCQTKNFSKSLSVECKIR